MFFVDLQTHAENAVFEFTRFRASAKNEIKRVALKIKKDIDDLAIV